MTTENTGGARTYSLAQRLADAHNIPGYRVSFTDEEAERLGAFDEDALSDASAMEGSYFNPEFIAEVEDELRR